MKIRLCVARRIHLLAAARSSAILALFLAATSSVSAANLVFQGGSWDDTSLNWRDASNNLVAYINSTATTPEFNGLSGALTVSMTTSRTTGSMKLLGNVTINSNANDFLLIGISSVVENSLGGTGTFNTRLVGFPGGTGSITMKGELLFNRNIEAGAGHSVVIAEGRTTLGANAVLSADSVTVGSANGPFVTLRSGTGSQVVTTGNMTVGETPNRTGIVTASESIFNIGGDLRLSERGDSNVEIDGGSLSIGGTLRLSDQPRDGGALASTVLTLRNTTLTVADSGGVPGINGTYFSGFGDIGVAPTFQLPGTRVISRGGQLNIGSLDSHPNIGLGVNNTIFDTTNGNITINGRLWGKALIKEGPGILKLTRDNRNGGGGGGVLDGTIVRGGFVEFSESLNLNDGGNFNQAANPSQTPTGLKNIQLNGGGLRWAAGATEDISHRLRLLNNFSFDTNGNNVTFATSLPGTGGMTKVGAGILKLAPTNTWTGGTTVNGGFVEFNSGATLGTGNVTLNGGGLRWATGNTTDISPRLNALGVNGGLFDTNGNNVTFAAAPITGAGLFSKYGGGTLTLQGTHPFTGGLYVNAGTVALLNATLADKETLVVGNEASGTFTMINSTLSTTGSVRLASTPGVSGTATVSGTNSLSAGTFIEVGSSGSGGLNISNGAQVTAASTVALAVNPFSIGEINVGGLGGAGGTTPATLSAGTALFVGYGSTGILNINNGGVVNVGSQVRLGELTGSSGVIILNTGGQLNVGGADGIRGGSGVVGFALAGGTLKVTGSSLTTTVPMTLTNQSLIDTSGVEATLGGVLSGSGGLTKTGGGNLHLTVPNSYAGGTTVVGGKIVVGAANALGTGPISVLTGTLQSTGTFSRNGTATVDGAGNSLSASSFIEIGANGTGSLMLTNGGLASTSNSVAFGVLAGANGSASVTGAGSTLTSGTTMFVGYLGTGSVTVGSGGTVNAGLLSLGSGNTGDATFNLNTGGQLNVGGVNGIVKGDGVATFNLAGGILKVTGSDLTSSVPMTLTNSSLIDTSGVTATLSGALSGTGGFTKTGGGVLNLPGANTYQGGTTNVAGKIVAASLGTGPVNVPGGIVEVTGNFGGPSVSVDGVGSRFSGGGFIEFGSSSASSLTVTNGGVASATASVAFGVGGGISGTGSVTGAGSQLNVGTTLFVGFFGTGSLSVGSGGTVSAGSVQFGGGGGIGTLNVNSGGQLNVGGTNGISNFGTANFNLAGGTLKVTGSSLTSSVPISLTNLSVIDTSGVTATLSGPISGPGGIAKTGGGTLTLGAVNTYTGPTSIIATLALGVSGALPDTSAVSLDGGTLDTNGFSETAGTLDVNFDSTINLAPGAVALAFANSSALLWTGTLTITGFTLGSDALRFGTDATGLTPSQLALVRFADYGNASGIIDSQGFVTVPEPSSGLLAACAGLMLVARRRR